MFFFLGKFRIDVYQLREAFQTKKWGNLGKVQNWGSGGGLQKSKQSQVPEGTKDSKNDDSFSSYEDTKT